MEQTKERPIGSFLFKRKKSPVWNHFKSTEIESKMECVYCHRVCSVSYGSTGNLIRHLKMRHPRLVIDKMKTENDHSNSEIRFDFTNELEESHSEAAQAVLNIAGSTHTDAEKPNHETEVAETQHMQYYLLEPVDENKARELNTQLLKFIIKELQPFTIVENMEFRKFLTILNPAYALPTLKDLKKTFLPDIYQTEVNELKSTLEEVTAVALTTDRWNSINNERWISVIAHYLNKDFQFQSSFLSCISFPEKHSSNHIAAFLQSVAVEWGISDKVIAIVTENVPSMTCAARECKWMHVSCFASVLNRIVNSGLVDIKLLLEKIRHTIAYFKRNTTAQKMLFEILAQKNLSHVKIKSDSSTRWNSTFEMIAKFLKIKEPIIIVINRLQSTLQLSTSEWIVLEKAVKLLMIFNSVAVEISSESTLSLSKVPYMVKFMVKHVSNILTQNDLPTEIKSMAEKFKGELQKYFSELESNSIIGQNVLLDPRFKKRGFPENSFDEAYSSLCKEISALKSNKINEKINLNQSKAHSHITESEYFIDIWSDFEEKKSVSQNNADESAIVEISTFMNDEYQSLSENPTVYWGSKLNQSKFPTIFELVKKRLCVPATAVSGQVIFTKQGSIFLEKRKCLISNNVQEILFLNHNL